jgi:uncharacterized protein
MSFCSHKPLPLFIVRELKRGGKEPMKDEKKLMDRRAFIKATTIGGASLALSAGVVAAAETEKGGGSKEIPKRVLGKTGVSIPILGMGGGDWTTNEALLRIAFQMGVTYWDSASEYENGKCELGIGHYFAKYPADRKKVFLVTKPTRAFTPKEMEVLLSQSLQRMQTDYVDLFSMQGVQDPSVLTSEVKAWSEQKKKEGKIKFFGFNAHANVPAMLMAASKLGWLDSVNCSYSYQMMNDEMKKGMDAISKAGIGFIAMKTQGQRFGGGPPPNMPAGQGGGPPGAGGQPQGQGGPQAQGGQPQGEGGPQGQGGQSQGQPPAMPAQTASKEPEDLSAIQHFIDKGYTLEQAKLKFVWADERVASCLSKMTSMTILKDNVTAASDGKKLTSLDFKVLHNLAQNTCNLYCRGCMQCEMAMASESRVYDVLRYMMYYNSYGERDQARELFRQMPDSIRSAMSSRDYSKAEAVCPNRIRIGSAMKEAASLLG